PCETANADVIFEAASTFFKACGLTWFFSLLPDRTVLAEADKARSRMWKRV
ncbi:Ntpase Kap Family P-Loop Domain-Containing Protein 1, partial [Manis pentadactyla]